MRRLFRRAAPQAASTPPETAPNAGSAPVVHPSPGLASLFAPAAADHVARILDLGPAVGANLAFYARFARTVRFVDLLLDALPEGTDSARRAPALLDECLRSGDEPYDLVLAWDLLNYLARDECRGLIERLTGCTRVGARLFAMVSSSRTMPARPLRFAIIDAQQIAYQEVGGGFRVSPNPAPAEVERLLAPFRVERSIVLSHGVREYVAVHPREVEGVDGETA